MSSSEGVPHLDGVPHLAEATRGLEEITAAGRTDAISQDDLQRLMRAVVRLYTAKFDADGGFPAVPRAGINATEAMVTASALLKATNLNVFELGLWQQWS